MSSEGRRIFGAQSFEGVAQGNTSVGVNGNFSVERDLSIRSVVVTLRLIIPEDYIIDNRGKDAEFGAVRSVLSSGALTTSEKLRAIAMFLERNVGDEPQPNEPSQPAHRRALDLTDA